jgi:glutamate carboxypeptidase
MISMDYSKIDNHLRSLLSSMLAALAELVNHESPSHDKPALDALADWLAERFLAVGAEVERIKNKVGGDHLRIQFSRCDRDDKAPALVLGHFDTVWPMGTLARLPFRVEADRAYGPGVFDMKVGLVIIEFALKSIHDLKFNIPRRIVVLLTSDEEIGSPTSRALIEAQARESAYALVLEPPLEGGRLKTARKGIGRFTVKVVGKAAHAGVEPEKGISAVVELAHQILRIQNLADPQTGTTLNVGVIQGGTAPNVVAAEATARVDVRVANRAEAQRIEQAFRSLQPMVPGARIEVRGGFERPPMERSAAIAALFDRARSIGHALGLELSEGSTGGGSDGNFTAALGVPTLDGLGALGSGAHADYEHILISSIPERAALLAALLLELDPENLTHER